MLMNHTVMTSLQLRSLFVPKPNGENLCIPYSSGNFLEDKVNSFKLCLVTDCIGFVLLYLFQWPCLNFKVAVAFERLNSCSQSASPRVVCNTALVWLCITGGGKRLHTLSSDATLGEPQGFSWGTLTLQTTIKLKVVYSLWVLVCIV